MIPSLDRLDAELAATSLRDYIPLAWPIVEPGTPFKSNWHIDTICDHLEAVSAGEIRRLIINIPPRHMKPVDESALVLMGDGSRRPLKDIAVGDQVIGHSGQSRTVTAAAQQGELPTLQITTASGRTVAAAHDHPFLTPEGWVRADELCVGQTLATVAHAAVTGTADLRLAAMAGYYVGDGCCTFNKTGSLHSNITAFDTGTSERIIELCTDLGWGAKWSTAPGRINISGGARPWLRQVGLAGQGSWTKRVPQFVMEGGPDAAAAFLGAYFECDGTMNQRGGTRRDLAVTFNSVSRDLLTDVQHLLLRVGVRSRLRRHVGASNYTDDAEYVSWRLTMTSRDDVATFAANIPLHGAKAAKIAEWAPLRTTFPSGLLPDEITEITDGGLRACRCLTVETDHSFTAEDLVVHNSLTVGVFWPTWAWLRHPELRWLFASYAEKLSKRDSLNCRRVIESKGGRREGGSLIERVGYQGLLQLLGDQWGLAADQNEKLRFENERTGYRLATSVGGAATGEGGDILVIDDPHKADEVESDVTRATVLDWMDGTMSTRLNDPSTGRVVIVMQRLHENDLTGHLLEQGGYQHLCLPAQYEPTHPFVWPDDPRTEPDELLWPLHFDDAAVTDLKKRLGSYRAAGQLQQRPAPAEGGIFKTAWWMYYDYSLLSKLDDLVANEIPDAGYASGLPHFTQLLQSWDTTMKEKTTSDYAVGQLWGIFGPDRYLLRQARGRWGLTETATQAETMSEWAAARWPSLTPKVLVENKANGPEVIAALRRRVQGVIPVNPSIDKVMRAEAITPQLEAGNIYVPGDRLMSANGWAPDPVKTPAWIQELINECSGFPAGTNDDQVDALTQALDPRHIHGSVKQKGRGTSHMRGLNLDDV